MGLHAARERGKTTRQNARALRVSCQKYCTREGESSQKKERVYRRRKINPALWFLTLHKCYEPLSMHNTYSWTSSFLGVTAFVEPDTLIADRNFYIGHL